MSNLFPFANWQTQNNEFSQSHQDNPYDTYSVHAVYEFDQGTRTLPLANMTMNDTEPPDPTQVGNRTPLSVVQVHAPIGTVTVMFQATRVGDWPIVPDPTPTNPNYRLSKVRIVTKDPGLLASGGSRRYSVDGVYIYHTDRPIWAKDGLPTGGNDYDINFSLTNTFGAANFDEDLLPQ